MEQYDGYYPPIPIFRFALREDLKNEIKFLPTRAEEKSSGWDVRAAMQDRKTLIIKPFEYVKIPLGLRGFCPEGWWYELRPRSSSFAKKNLHALYGVIDESYEGDLIFACQYIPEVEFETECDIISESLYNSERIESRTNITAPNLVINFGDAVGQIIPIRRQEMKVMVITNEEYEIYCKERNASRGTGGFGSTSL